ncbi:MAG: class I tRNA ligase family protein, partial [Bacteroidota bacterium]
FNGILDPENEDIRYYYPTNDLVTAPEILFFWVARMIIAGYEYRNEKPFENVYLTGIVRDKQRRKMSKSLGNSPDPLELIKRYGADGVRVGMLLCSPAGNDLMFDEELCRQGSGFANKIWNAFRLIKSWETAPLPQPETAAIAVAWYKTKFQHTLRHIEDNFGKYRISDALMSSYKLIWDDFCSWFLEIVKPDYGHPVDEKTYASVIAVLEANLRLLHPFMPFLTEEIWQHIKTRTPEEALIIEKWPENEDANSALLEAFDFTAEIITAIRALRKEQQISFKEPLTLLVLDHEKDTVAHDSIVKKMGNISDINRLSDKMSNALSFRVKANEYFIPVEAAVNKEDEIKKLKEELAYTEGFLKTVQKKLLNERFVNNAPEAVVDLERKKEADALSKIKILKESLNSLG